MNLLLLFILFFPILHVFAFPQMDQLRQTKEGRAASFAFVLQDLDTGKELISYRPEEYLQTASLQKILLSYAALEFLGEDYQFITTLEVSGEVKNGCLQGDVLIRGGGDPVLPLEILDEWALALKASGIRQIQGTIFADQSCFESRLSCPSWEFADLGNYYAGGVSGLTIGENSFQVTFEVGDQEGAPTKIKACDPHIPGLALVNEVRTGAKGSGDQAYIYGSEYSLLRYLRGTVPLGNSQFSIRGAIPDPALFSAEQLQMRVPSSDVQVIRIPKKEHGNQWRVLHTKVSPKLSELLMRVNQRSHNLIAEHIFKAIGGGSADESILRMKQLFQRTQIFPQIQDGSGLSRLNLMTARDFVKILSIISSSEEYHFLMQTFPEAGKQGTMKRFPIISNGKILAKTGTMQGTYNMAGYFFSKKGKRYAFCLLSNYYFGNSRESIRDYLVQVFQSLP